MESPFFLAFLDPEGDSPKDTATVGGVYFAHPEIQVHWGVQQEAFARGGLARLAGSLA